MNQPATTTRRRWSSYSLRSLFVLITLVAIGLAWVASEQRHSRYEREITEQIGASDVVFAGLFDPQPPEKPSWWRTALGDLLGSRVRTLSANPSLTDLLPLAGLKNLKELSLNDSQVSDLSPLAGLKNLRRLSFSSTQVTDLSPLSGLKDLKWLFLNDTPVSDLSPYSVLLNLELLSLGHTQVGDLSPLSGLKNLHTLWLAGTRVSNLRPLSGLKKLKYLNLVGTPVSDEQVKLLQQALPNCMIVR